MGCLGIGDEGCCCLLLVLFDVVGLLVGVCCGYVVCCWVCIVVRVLLYLFTLVSGLIVFVLCGVYCGWVLLFGVVL